MISRSEKLVSIGSEPLTSNAPSLSSNLIDLAGSLTDELCSFLAMKNGFLAFESALHVFPTDNINGLITLEVWNSDELWRKNYESLAENCLFFSQDIFGGQFCIFNNKIYSFDPETGDKEFLANSIEEWASLILDEYNLLTGYSLAHEWQEMHGVLPIDMRLIPKTPFACEGDFAIQNLYMLDSINGMKFRADIFRQIRNLPDGTKIRFQIDG